MEDEGIVQISEAEPSTSTSSRSIISMLPRLRFPIRQSPNVASIPRLPTVRTMIENRHYTPANTHHYELTIDLSNYQFVRDAIFTPWFGTAPRSEILTRHNLTKPFPNCWADMIPQRRFVRLLPSSEGNGVTAITSYRNMIIIGLNKGHLSIYDMGMKIVVREYVIKEGFAVNQIVVGKKRNRFFVSCFDQFVEYSYDQEAEIFRFQCRYSIRKILANDNPMLIIDAGGNAYEYLPDTEGIEIAVLKVVGLKLDAVTSIEELKSSDPYVNEISRPLLVKNRSCIAVIDISLKSNQKVTLWRKEMLTQNPEDNVLACAFEEKYFYSIISKILTPSSNMVYVSLIRDIGSSARVDFIKTTSGSIHAMKCSERYLIVLTRTKQLEFFNANSHVKYYHISFRHSINNILVVRNTLIAGTNEGSMIIEGLYMECDQVCSMCRNSYYFEPFIAFKRCVHNIPPEHESVPLGF